MPRAFTLIEMLIVVTIMMILVAAAATTLRPANDSRRIREAARAVDLYLASARNRAMETGRPCGVMLRRFNGTTSAMTMDQCEVPAPYCGDTETSTAVVTATTARLCAADDPAKLLRYGDLIQFNYQGPCYTIENPNETNKTSPDYGFIPGPWRFNFTAGTTPVPWTGQSVPYRIFRAPVKNAAQPLQLPATAIVDLSASGTDTGLPNTTAPFGPNDVIILFSPSGSIQCVYVGGNQYAITEPIFLLVGKQERMGTAFTANPQNETDMTNYQDLNNLWVVINPQTGLVTTDVMTSSTKTVDTDVLYDSRQLAREGQGMGGK